MSESENGAASGDPIKSRSPTPNPRPLGEEMVEYYVMDELSYEGTLAKGDPRGKSDEADRIFEPGAKKFSVRGADYLTSKKKVASGPSILRFAGADLLYEEGNAKACDVCRHPETLPAQCPGREFVVLNWQLPASPPFSFVVYYVVPTEEELSADESEEELAVRRRALALIERFMAPDATDEYRNNRFKLIPQIVDGPWLVRKMTPSNVPALIGNKITTTYHRGKNYFEIDVDITSSTAASSIWGLINRTLPSLVIDLAFVLQGNTEDELPEQIFGTVRISHVTLSQDKMKKLSPAE